MIVGRLLSFWDGLFSRASLNFQEVFAFSLICSSSPTKKTKHLPKPASEGVTWYKTLWTAYKASNFMSPFTRKKKVIYMIKIQHEAVHSVSITRKCQLFLGSSPKNTSWSQVQKSRLSRIFVFFSPGWQWCGVDLTLGWATVQRCAWKSCKPLKNKLRYISTKKHWCKKNL